MRIWFLSDLHHHSSWPFEPPASPPDADILVIAGDAGEEMSRRAIPWVSETFRRYGLPIIYVPGNHDFYHGHLTHEVTKARLVAEHYGIHLLATGQSIVVGGVRFVGATLWTDYDLGHYGHFAEHDAMRWLNDFRYIRAGNYRRALPKDVIDAHYEQRIRIEKILSEPFDGLTVVATHHAPLERSLQKGKVDEPLDAAYASNLATLIEQYRPEVWLHGHIHVSHDYTHAETRIVTNPRGYLRGATMLGRGRTYPENPNFDPLLVIEITPRPKDDPSADQDDFTVDDRSRP
jgi:Icc-related predicted phosphoesterase